MTSSLFAASRGGTGDVEVWLKAQGWLPDVSLGEPQPEGGERVISGGRQAIVKRHSNPEEYRQERDNLLLLHLVAPGYAPRLLARADANLWLLLEDAGAYTYAAALGNGEMVAAWRVADAIATVHAASRAHIATLPRPTIQKIDLALPIASTVSRTRRTRIGGAERKALTTTEQMLTRAMTDFSATGLRYSLGSLAPSAIVLTDERVVFTEQMHPPLGFPHDDLTLFSDHPLRGEVVARYLATRARLGDTIDAAAFQRIYAYREIGVLAGMLGYLALTAFPSGAVDDTAAQHYADQEQMYLAALMTTAAAYPELQSLLTAVERAFALPYAA